MKTLVSNKVTSSAFKYEKPYRVTAYDIKRKETSFDPVKQTFTDPYIETKAKDQESKSFIEKLAANRVIS